MRMSIRLAMLLSAALLLVSGLAVQKVAADRSVDVVATEFSYTPPHINALPEEKLTVRLSNTGRAPHDIVFLLDGERREQTDRIRGGERITLTFTTPTVLGRYIYYCSVGNHRAMGMEGELVVAETLPTAAPATETPTEMPTQATPPTDEPSPTATPTPRPLYLPRLLRFWPPVPDKPILQPIYNGDQDNGYAVQWTPAARAQTYVLSEANDPSMAGARVVYQGPATAWAVPPPGKTPATYFYSVKAQNSDGESGASGVQSVTIFPLFVGMQSRWDGVAQLRGSESVDIGNHGQRNVNALVDADTVNVHGSFWYDPNPLNWESDSWDAQYVLSTSRYKPSPSDPPDDGTVKWGYGWIASSATQFVNGQTLQVDGQPFSTSGPHAQAAFGRQIQYWQLVNQTEILAYHDGDWKSYVRPGRAILWYDAASSHFLVHEDVTYAYYYKNRDSGDTGRDLGDLTSSNAYAPAAFADLAADTVADTVSGPRSEEQGAAAPRRSAARRYAGEATGRSALPITAWMVDRR